MNNNLIFQNSWWYFALAFLVAIAYAVFLYIKKDTLGKNIRILLAFIRAVLVFLIIILLLKPLLRSNEVLVLKPIVVVGVDNSKSVGLSNAEQKKQLDGLLQDLNEDLGNKNFELVIKDLEGENLSLDSTISFDKKQTNISSFFKNVEEEFAGQNLHKVVLITDGINNAGYLPVSKNYKFQINTVGLGDTTIQRDIAIKSVTINKLAYLGNSFPVKVSISANLLKGKQSKLRIKSGDVLLGEQLVNIENDDFFQEFSFNLNATNSGIQRFQIEIIPINGEKSTANNYRSTVIEVVDGKEKVLILALNPHPDLKALKSILTINDLLDVKIFNLQSDAKELFMNEDFDLLILHQLPDVYDIGNSVVTKLLSKGKPTLFILGELSNISRFNGMQEAIGINSSGSKTDRVMGTINQAFRQFNVQIENNDLFEKLPPLIAPFGEYAQFPATQSILFQKIGNLQTERPLLAINTAVTRKTAVLAGEGLWKWRLEEYGLNKNHIQVDDLILKTIQLLSLKENKDKLRIYPVAASFDIDEPVRIQSEAYNSLLERIYDVNVNLVLKGPNGYTQTLNYKITEGNPIFELSKLSEGVYTYSANALILGKKEATTGQFVVTSKDLEFFNTRADFDLLRTLSKNSGGDFFTVNQGSDIISDLSDDKVKGKITNNESLLELINLKWLLGLFILLLSIEWILRKYKGTY